MSFSSSVMAPGFVSHSAFYTPEHYIVCRHPLQVEPQGASGLICVASLCSVRVDRDKSGHYCKKFTLSPLSLHKKRVKFLKPRSWQAPSVPPTLDSGTDSSTRTTSRKDPAPTAWKPSPLGRLPSRGTATADTPGRYWARRRSTRLPGSGSRRSPSRARDSCGTAAASSRCRGND